MNAANNNCNWIHKSKLTQMLLISINKCGTKAFFTKLSMVLFLVRFRNVFVSNRHKQVYWVGVHTPFQIRFIQIGLYCMWNNSERAKRWQGVWDRQVNSIFIHQINRKWAIKRKIWDILIYFLWVWFELNLSNSWNAHKWMKHNDLSPTESTSWGENVSYRTWFAIACKMLLIE